MARGPAAEPASLTPGRRAARHPEFTMNTINPIVVLPQGLPPMNVLLVFGVMLAFGTLGRLLAGRVVGSITAKDLVVLRSARIEGDVQYDALTIEQGAHVDGRLSHRVPGKAEPAKIAEPVLTLAN